MKLKIALICLVLSAVLALNYFINDSDTVESKQISDNNFEGKIEQKSEKINNSQTTDQVKKGISIDGKTLDEKREIVDICHDSFKVMDRTSYIKMQAENFGEMTERQIRAWEQLFTFCADYKAVSLELQKEMDEHPFYDPESGFAYPYMELKELANEKGKEEAIAEAEETLFSEEKAVRESASTYLLEDEDWINRLTEKANIDEDNIDTKISNIAAAIELRKCELNIEDCSVNSLGALRACGYNPDFCGMSLYDTLTRFLSPYELEIIESYLRALRGG